MKAIQINAFVKDLTSLTPQNIPSTHSTPSSSPTLHIKITHAAITHVDLLYAQGLHQNNKRHILPPFTLGTEFAGIVLSSTPASPSFPSGTRVFGSGLGAYAEEICVPEGNVRRVPERWGNDGACAVGVSGAVAYGALIGVAGLKRGETVVVFGASGGLGVMGVQIARAVGARVVGVVGGREKEGVLRGVGVDEVVDYRVEGWEERVRGLTEGGEGADVVFDGVGAVESGVRCLRYRGRLVVVGFAGRGGDVETVRANRILLKSVMVHGYRFGEDGRRDPQRTKDVWEGFMKLVDAGKIEPVIYKEQYMGLEAVPRALEDAKEHRTWGRAVLRINEDAEKDDLDRARL
ncbi:NAD(P)-binding protein [Plenodomus tracheiphilus IPT5]|uniref:NAD(P)-binding protein n=1 Tax=Plenodomus tracheiphilus IPT5 TaxID=1408161 RepID=A0A6A7BNW4_9PLEO|nr:NAD(P)-binding protein [Plenodomus tracheiphilus IPT5]